MKVVLQLVIVATLYVFTTAMPTPFGPQFFVPPAQQQRNRPRPLRPVHGGILSGIFNPQQPAVPALPAAPADPVGTPGVSPPASPGGEITPGTNLFANKPFFTEGASTGADPNGGVGGLIGMLNGGQFGSATAGGAGNGAVQDGSAIGQGTGVADAGKGGFGIGLGIGGAIATPLGDLAFGQGDSTAVGK